MGTEWRSARLCDLTSFINRGGAPAYVDAGGIIVLNQKCVREHGVLFDRARRTDPARKTVTEARMLRPLDVLVNSTGMGTLGRVAQVLQLSEPATVDSHITIVRPGDGVDGRFLGFALRCRQADIESLAEGSTGQTELSRGRLASLEVLVPPLAVQRTIAHILGALDDKIELSRKQNATLEAMARALFKSWFVDFDPVRAKAEGRAPNGMDTETAKLFPSEFVESELGPIPDGWSVAALQDMTSYLSRGIGPAYIDDGGVCVLNQKCIRGHRVDVSKARRHDAAKRSVEGRLVHDLDVLVNSTGVGTLGRVAQLWRLTEDTVVDSHVTVVRAANNVDPWFLGLGVIGREPEIEALGEGSTGQTELSRARLGSLLGVRPPEDLQRRFGSAASRLLRRVAANEGEAQALERLRDDLLPRLLTGELSVDAAEREVEAVA